MAANRRAVIQPSADGFFVSEGLELAVVAFDFIAVGDVIRRRTPPAVTLVNHISNRQDTLTGKLLLNALLVDSISCHPDADSSGDDAHETNQGQLYSVHAHQLTLAAVQKACMKRVQ
jgi:hypothetical protein